jgi:hypothetical protein
MSSSEKDFQAVHFIYLRIRFFLIIHLQKKILALVNIHHFQASLYICLISSSAFIAALSLCNPPSSSHISEITAFKFNSSQAKIFLQVEIFIVRGLFIATDHFPAPKISFFVHIVSKDKSKGKSHVISGTIAFRLFHEYNLTLNNGRSGDASLLSK